MPAGACHWGDRMETELRTGTILRGMAGLIGANALVALAALAILTAIGMAADFYPEAVVLPELLIVAASIIGQYLVTRQALASAGVAIEDRAGAIFSVLGVAIIVGIASGLGLLLLIVPGVYLYARWSIAIPVVLAEGERMDPAMRASRDRTRGNIVPIALALVATNLPWVAAMPILIFVYPEEGPVPIDVALAGNVLLFTAYVLTWYAMVATYVLLQPTHELEEVFA